MLNVSERKSFLPTSNIRHLRSGFLDWERGRALYLISEISDAPALLL
jgi:hypothetical protein